MIGVDVVIGGNGVDDEIEAAGVLFHLVGIAGDDSFISAEAERVLLLVRRGGKHHDVGSERVAELSPPCGQARRDQPHRLSCPCPHPSGAWASMS